VDNPPGSVDAALREMHAAGVALVRSDDIEVAEA